MFKRSFKSRDRAGKAIKSSKRSFREQTKLKMQQKMDSPPTGRLAKAPPTTEEHDADEGRGSSTLTSPIVTLIVGRDQRLFAAHEDVLSLSPFFKAALKGQFFESASKRVELLDEYVTHIAELMFNK